MLSISWAISPHLSPTHLFLSFSSLSLLPSILGPFLSPSFNTSCSSPSLIVFNQSSCFSISVLVREILSLWWVLKNTCINRWCSSFTFLISTYSIIITIIMFLKAVLRSWWATREMKKVYTDSLFRWCSWTILCSWGSWKKLKKSTVSNTLVRFRFLAVSISLSMFRRLSMRRFIAVIVTVTDTTTIATTTTTTICDVSEDLCVWHWFGLVWHVIDWFGLVWLLFWDWFSLLSDDDEKYRVQLNVNASLIFY